MRGWIRWASRSRTSTPSGAGGPQSATRRSTRPARLPDGTKFDGRAGLIDAILPAVRVSSPTTLTERLLTYALGRGVEYYDAPAMRAIVREAAADDYRFSALVAGHRQERAVPDAGGVRSGTRHRVAEAGTERAETPLTGVRSRRALIMFISKMSLPRRTFLRGHGRDAGAAAARRHGAGALGAGATAASRPGGSGSSTSRTA